MTNCVDLTNSGRLTSIADLSKAVNKSELRVSSFVRLFYFLRNKGNCSEFECDYYNCTDTDSLLKPICVLGEGNNNCTLNQSTLKAFRVQLTLHSVVTETDFSSNRVKVLRKNSDIENLTGYDIVNRVLEPCYKRGQIIKQLDKGKEVEVLCQKWFVTLKIIREGSKTRLGCQCDKFIVSLNKKQLSYLGVYTQTNDYYCGELNYFLALLNHICGGDFYYNTSESRLALLIKKLSEHNNDGSIYRCPELKSKYGFAIHHSYQANHYFGGKLTFSGESELCICENKSVYNSLWDFM